MLIETSHSVVEPERFAAAIDAAPALPVGVDLVASIARKNHHHFTCVWKADSIDQVKNFIESIVHKTAHNSYYEVEHFEGPTSEDSGLPAAFEDPNRLHQYGKHLAGEYRHQEALAVFQRNATRHPEVWYTDAGLARGYAGVGEWDKAVQCMKRAFRRAPGYRASHIRALLARLESHQSIA